MTGQRDGTIALRTTRGTHRRSAHGVMAYTVARLPDGYATAGFDGRVRIWDAALERELSTFTHSGALIFSVSASSDGKFLLSAGAGVCCLWNVATGERIFEAANDHGVHGVAALASDADFWTGTGDDAELTVWRGADRVRTIPLDWPYNSAVTLTPDGSTAILAEATGRVRAVDIGTGTAKVLHAAHEDWIRSVDVTANGRFVVSASQNYVGAVYDLEQGRLVDAASGGPVATVCPAGPSSVVLVDNEGGLSRVDL